MTLIAQLARYLATRYLYYDVSCTWYTVRYQMLLYVCTLLFFTPNYFNATNKLLLLMNNNIKELETTPLIQQVSKYISKYLVTSSKVQSNSIISGKHELFIVISLFNSWGKAHEWLQFPIICAKKNQGWIQSKCFVTRVRFFWFDDIVWVSGFGCIWIIKADGK